MRWAVLALSALLGASAAVEIAALRWEADAFDGGMRALMGEPLPARAPEAEPAWPGVVATVGFSRGDPRSAAP